jgi:hypothetical protein
VDSMQLQHLMRTTMACLALLLFAASAKAAPIAMSPDPVTLDGINGTFTLSLASGDTSTNSLEFDLLGSDQTGFFPTTGLAAIVFDGTSVVSATELSDPDNLIYGLSIPGTGVVAGVLVDFGTASEATFQVVLGSTPTTATIYSLNLKSTSTLYDSTSWQRLAIEKVQVSFSSADGASAPVPEPAAALCFASGLALVASRLRRRP